MKHHRRTGHTTMESIMLLAIAALIAVGLKMLAGWMFSETNQLIAAVTGEEVTADEDDLLRGGDDDEAPPQEPGTDPDGDPNSPNDGDDGSDPSNGNGGDGDPDGSDTGGGDPGDGGGDSGDDGNDPGDSNDPGDDGEEDPDTNRELDRDQIRQLLNGMVDTLNGFPDDSSLYRPKENIADAIHVIRNELDKETPDVDLIGRMIESMHTAVGDLPDMPGGIGTPPKEAMSDYVTALEIEFFGDSKAIRNVWQDYENQVALSEPVAPGKRRFEGLMITGRLPFAFAEGNGTQVFLRDTTTGEIYEYAGVGGGAGVGAFVGWTMAPFEVDLSDPSNLPEFSGSVGGAVAFGVGGGAGGTVARGEDGIEVNPEFSIALGIGASGGGGVSYLRYRGKESTFARRWLLDIFW